VTGRCEPGLDIIHRHGAGTDELAVEDRISAGIADQQVTALVRRQNITPAKLDQPQSLALPHPAQPGLSGLLGCIHAAEHTLSHAFAIRTPAFMSRKGDAGRPR
jgi:hypothetical protein